MRGGQLFGDRRLAVVRELGRLDLTVVSNYRLHKWLEAFHSVRRYVALLSGKSGVRIGTGSPVITPPRSFPRKVLYLPAGWSRNPRQLSRSWLR
jgi:hypothetical protein